MNTSEIISGFKKATAFDIFLISFFALPFVFDAWIGVFTKIGWNQSQIFRSLIILMICYVVIVAFLVVDNYNKKRKEIAKDRILGHLHGKGIKWISFEKIRQNINPSYNDAFLESLIREFPREVREVILRGNRVAIAAVIMEATDEEEV